MRCRRAGRARRARTRRRTASRTGSPRAFRPAEAGGSRGPVSVARSAWSWRSFSWLVGPGGRARASSARARSRGRRGAVSADVRDVLEELLPGRVGRLLVLLDALDGVRRSSLDVTLMRTEDLRLQLQGRGREDLPDGRVAEERI